MSEKDLLIFASFSREKHQTVPERLLAKTPPIALDFCPDRRFRTVRRHFPSEASTCDLLPCEKFFGSPFVLRPVEYRALASSLADIAFAFRLGAMAAAGTVAAQAVDPVF